MHKHLHGWVRQTKLRAKQKGCFTSLVSADAEKSLEDFDNHCAYCGQPASVLDLAFPISGGGPCIGSNVLPCCGDCKRFKHGRDIIEYFRSGRITRELLTTLLQYMMLRDKSGLLKRHAQHLLKESS